MAKLEKFIFILYNISVGNGKDRKEIQSLC